MTDKEHEEFIKRWKETQPLRPALLTDTEWKSSLESYVLGYESPITLIAKEMETKMEGDVMNVVQQYGINVNKEELLKALMYDRDQYAKGYAKGRRDFERPQGEWIKGEEIAKTKIGDKEFSEYKDFTCSNCRVTLDYLLYWSDGSPFYKFCPNCGARMKGEDNDG